MRNTLPTLLLSAVAVAALTACSGGGDQAAPSAPKTTSTSTSAARAATASNTTSRATSADPTPGEAIDARAFTAPIRTAVDAAKSYHLTERRSTEPAPSIGRISGSGSDRLMAEADMPGQGTVRLVNGDAYLKTPDTDGKWLKFAKSSNDPDVRAMLASLVSEAGDNGDLDIWESGKVTFVGDESGGKHFTVVAPAVRFYDETIDEESTSQTDGPVNTAADKVKLAGKTVGYDVWLDKANRPAKIKFDSTSLTGLAFSAKTDEVVFRSTTTFSKWGEPVSVQVPPAAQTVDAEKFMGPGTSAV